jgi:hypothetical protein
VPGSIPPTGRKRAVFGNTARHALSVAGPSVSAGNSLSAAAPARSAAKPFARGRHAGEAGQAGARGGRDHRRVGVRAHDQPAAGVGEAAHVDRVEDGAGADHDLVAELPRHQRDAGERLGRVERDLDQAEAGVDQRAADREGLVGLEAAQDRDQGQGGEGALEGAAVVAVEAVLSGMVPLHEPAPRASTSRPAAALSGEPAVAARPRWPMASR